MLNTTVVTTQRPTVPPTPKTFSQVSPTQEQTAVVANPSEKFRLVQTQNGKTMIYTSSTEKAPESFNIVKLDHGLTPPNIVPPRVTEAPPVSSTSRVHTKYLPSRYIESKENNIEIAPPKPKFPDPDSYVSVTKQVTGIDEKNGKIPQIPGKNFESTYYTKSSTCGYFTFSCNIVYGANGRSKICRPKPPTNGKC